MDEAPHWFKDHEKEDTRRFDEISQILTEINQKLDPLLETYKSAGTLGKWLMAAAVFFSIMLGIALSIKSLFIR